MKIYFSVFVLLLIVTGLSIAQDAQEIEEYNPIDESVVEEAPKKLILSGSVDVYYRANIKGDDELGSLTSFANLPGFSMGMVNFIAAQEGKDFGFKADLVFGPRGEDATFMSSVLRPGGSSNVVNQLYVFWKMNEDLTFTIGNFNTFLGYEVISPVDNFNYSTSYMFSYGPFSHTGLKVDYAINDKLSVMAGVFNPTDATEFNPTNEYTAGLQIAYENGPLNFWVNTLAAKDFLQFDLTAGYDITESIYLGLNATTALDNFSGIAGYLQVATSDKLKLGLRVENFQDQGLGLFSEGESVTDFTLSANYQIGNLVIIPEIRMDSFSEKVIPFESELVDSSSSFVLAAVYGF